MINKVNNDLKEIEETKEDKKLDSSDQDSDCSSGSSDHLSNHESSPDVSPQDRLDKSVNLSPERGLENKTIAY